MALLVLLVGISPARAQQDPLGRAVALTDAMGKVTAYTYGPFGALSTVTTPGGTITRTLRDAFGRVRTSIDPDKGTTLLDYNGFGELRSSLDAQGRSTTFHRDLLGRLTARDDQAGGSPLEVTTWTWDTAPLGTGGRLALGALAQVEAPGGMATAYTYDDLGRLVTTERTIAGELFETSATYDDLGRLSTLTYPSAPGLTPFTVKNEYDPHGHLIQVRDPANKTANQVPYWRLTGTDEADRIAAESFGNGFVTRRDYYGDRGALKSILSELPLKFSSCFDADIRCKKRFLSPFPRLRFTEAVQNKRCAPLQRRQKV